MTSGNPWLTTSMANRKMINTLGRGRPYMMDMSSTSGYHQYVIPVFFLTCPQLVVPESWWRILVPRCVSCSNCCVSCRVNILRVNKFCVVLCQNSVMATPHVDLLEKDSVGSLESKSGICEPLCSKKTEITGNDAEQYEMVCLAVPSDIFHRSVVLG